MKVLVLGAGGLIGHKLVQVLSADSDMEVYAALHHSSVHPIFSGSNVISNIDVLDFSRLIQLVSDNRIDVILNCVGITKRNRGNRQSGIGYRYKCAFSPSFSKLGKDE